MATEIELKLSLHAKDAHKLIEHPLLKAIPCQRQKLLNTYYDTPELLLHARRIALRFRKKGWDWLLTVKTAEPASGGLARRSEWECAATPGVFDFSHVDAPELRELLDSVRGNLVPVFTTDFRRLVWQVPYGESLIEVALDRGKIAGGERTARICEVELELLDGRIEDIFGLTRKLQSNLRLQPSIASKAERGYRAFLGTPETPFKAKPVALKPEQTPVDAFRSIALACLEHFQRNEAGLLAGGEAEFIHQARVALRRLRSAIKLFAPVLPADFVATYGRTWQALASALGEARNWDVFLEETLPPLRAAFPHAPDTQRLQRYAEKRTKAARQGVIKLLSLREYPRLILEFTAAIHALPEAAESSLPDFATRRIARHRQSVCKLAARYAELDDQQRHMMRLRFKKLRYAGEFLAGVLPKEGSKRRQAALGELQEILGLINDLVTASALIDEALGRKNLGVARGWVGGRQEILIAQVPALLAGWLDR